MAFCSYDVHANFADMRPWVFLPVLMVLASSPAEAQQPAAPNASSACTYDVCALRLERRHVLRGASGQAVFTLGMWGAPSLRPHVASSDSALKYAAEFDRHYTVGTRAGTLGLLGAAVMGALYAHHQSGGQDFSDRELIGHLGGLALSFGLTLYGDRRVDRAMQGLVRAIWWSNREFPP